jgi:hypothetical protein
MIVLSLEIHQGQVGDVRRQSHPIGQHDLRGQAEAQRVEAIVLGNADEIRRERSRRHAHGVAGELRAAVRVDALMIVVVPDEGSDLGARRPQERVAQIDGAVADPAGIVGLQRIRIRDEGWKILVVHVAARDLAGTEESLDEPSAGVIDAGEGFAGDRVQVFIGEPGGENFGVVQERLRRANGAGAEPEARPRLHLPLGSDRRRQQRRLDRHAGDGRPRIGADEPIIEADAHDIGG